MLVRETSRWLLTLAAALLLSTFTLIAPIAAQENRATIVGTVVDQNGGVIPNAAIKATNTETNAVTTTTSNESGIYTLPFLPVGKYQITATATGLKTTRRDNVELRVGDRIQLDFAMEVGSVSETVTVISETPLLETATASRGQVIDESKVRDLPLLGRNPFLLAALASGVQITSTQGSISFRPFDNGGMDAISINGGRQRSNEFLIDGQPNTGTENGGIGALSFVPSPDAVQEFKVQSNTYDAQFGRTGGGTVNVSLKGGTNKLHGALYHYFRNDVLNANPFQSNAANSRRTAFRWNQPGLVVDGPIWIPKVYNGKDKAFFMFSWEKIKSSIPSPVTLTVPTLEQRAGDFSKTFQANGSPIIIYDPICTGTPCTRTPFANNRIPTNRLNPVALKLLDFIPLPNLPGNTQGFNNFFNGPNARTDEYDQFASRIDYSLSDKHKLSGRWLRNNRHELRGLAGYKREASPFFAHYRKNQGGGMDFTSTLSPTLVSNFKINFIRHEFAIEPYSDGFDFTQLGFPAALKSQVARSYFPSFTLTDYSQFGGVTFAGAPGNRYTFSDASTFSEVLNKTSGSHSLKFGGEVRFLRDNYISPSSSVGIFNFTRAFTQRDPLVGDAASGNAFASLLLGHPNNASAPINASFAYQHLYYGAFFQDDWRISRKLTLNLGLRWDYESPTSERFNQLNAGFDKTSPSPIQPPDLQLKGGLLFVNQDNRLPFKRDLNNFGPRVGFAYQLNDKTVMRGGYGVSYLPVFDPGTSLGFSVNTEYVASTDGGITPANSLSNPYPNGLVRPSGAAGGLSTLVGQGFTFYRNDVKIPMNHQFSFGVQREIFWGQVFEVNYSGSRTRKLITAQNINEVSAADLARGAAYLNERITNKMAGFIPGNAALNAPMIVRSQTLRPFPQFLSLVEDRNTIGRSWYNSLQMRVEKRLSKGLHYLFSYTFSKNMEAIAYLNAQDPIGQLASVVTADHTPHRAMISGGYDLPFFKDSSPLVRGIAGGWKVNLIGNFQTGVPIGMPGGVFLIGDPKLDNPTRDRWFNTCTLTATGARQTCANASETPVFQVQPAFTLRSASLRFKNILTSRPPTFDVSLFKAFRIKEGIALQLRGEAFNFANTPWFGAPNLTVGPNLGIVGPTQVNDQRQIQLGLKLIF